MGLSAFGRLLSVGMCTPAKAGAQNSSANLAFFRTGPRLSPGYAKAASHPKAEEAWRANDASLWQDIMIRIRSSTSADGERILQIWRDAVDATHDFLTAVDRIAIEEEVKGFLPAAPLWLAVDAADRPIGFMLLDGTSIEALFIDPAHRAAGIGRALVEHALARHPTLTTEVNEQNAQAVGFYECMGFVPTGRSARDGQGRAYPLIHLRFAAHD